MKALVVLALLVFMIPIGINSAFALTTYTINIPTGAASPEAPYFWASEKDGNTDGVIIVEKFDTVQWGNADSLPHTVTSGTVPSETDDRGPDGIFDSGLFYRGDYFRYQFNEVGDYPYFCLIHPWMEGVVHVVGSSTSGVQTIFGVGSDAGDGQTTFRLDYILDRNLASITVNERSKSLILLLSGNSLGDELTIMLPEDLIKNPNAVWIDDVQVTNFDSEKNGDTTTLRIPLEFDSEEVTIQGTAVVPEFGPIAIIILGIAIISMIAFSSKTQKIGILK